MHNDSAEELAASSIRGSVEYARQVMDLQRPAVGAEAFDFEPAFLETVVHQFMIGAMWRFMENYEFPTTPRDRAFLGYVQYLVDEGLPLEKAMERMRSAVATSRTTMGEDSLAIYMGHTEPETPGALAEVLKQFRSNVEVSGSSARMIQNSKVIAAVATSAVALIAWILGAGLLRAFGAGILAGAAVLATSLILYRNAIKNQESARP
jgi:hypothetical protein